MKLLLLAAMLSSGCALHRPLVAPGQTVVVTWSVDSAVIVRQVLVVDADMGHGWILAHDIADIETLLRVNLNQALSLTEYAAVKTAPVGHDAVRERASR